VGEKDVDYALEIRNSLMAIATLNLGRRSLELTTVTLGEASEAEEKVVNGDDHFIISVKCQKTSGTGNPAPLSLEGMQFRALQR